MVQMSQLKKKLRKTLKSPEQILEPPRPGGQPKQQRRKLDATLSTDTQKGSNGGSIEALQSQRKGERRICEAIQRVPWILPFSRLIVSLYIHDNSCKRQQSEQGPSRPMVIKAAMAAASRHCTPSAKVTAGFATSNQCRNPSFGRVANINLAGDGHHCSKATAALHSQRRDECRIYTFHIVSEIESKG